jgi:hypothetical protein
MDNWGVDQIMSEDTFGDCSGVGGIVMELSAVVVIEVLETVSVDEELAESTRRHSPSRTKMKDR